MTARFGRRWWRLATAEHRCDRPWAMTGAGERGSCARNREDDKLAELGSLTACESVSHEIFRAASAAGSADRLPERDARLRRPHCVGDIQDRFNLKIGEGSELGCGFG
jgi:hypothetical protein